jgi:phosphoglycolate phosphatase-like HAD superfamily hydrolase
MIVFDVDGTLLGGEEYDWRCFDAAFEEAAGMPMPKDYFPLLEEVTAQAIVHQVLGDIDLEQKTEIELRTRQGFLARLKQVHATNEGAFPPAEGAASLLEEIRGRGIPLAIATGDWSGSITFKLRAAGICFEGIPMATASEFYSRADIIAAAVHRAGGKLEDAVYVGDGVWDLKATQKLGVPFIGCGERRQRLWDAGAEFVLDSFEPDEFWEVYGKVRGSTSRGRL